MASPRSTGLPGGPWLLNPIHRLVYDSSSLIALAGAERLDVVRALILPFASEHVLPEAVWAEIPTARDAVSSSGWPTRTPDPPGDEYRTAYVMVAGRTGLKAGRARGETAVIAHAMVAQPTVVGVLDDAVARTLAGRLTVRYTGLLGLLGLAHDSGQQVDGLVRTLGGHLRMPPELRDGEAFSDWWPRHRRPI